VRGIAVAVVLLFHGGFAWAKGGYLGVSTFFTLSGFLITGILVSEWSASGGIVLSRFWARRFRRLLPALLVAVGVVCVYAKVLAPADQLANIRADGLAALGYVANWRFIVSGQSYAALFAAPSPLLHVWSLAIEEQFYVVYPLLVFGVLVLGRGRRSVLAGVLATLAVASVVTSFVLGSDHTRTYYGTDTRAVELLLGALLAIWVAGRPELDRRRRHPIATLGVVALAVMAVCWVTTGQSSGWLYRGGFAGYGVLSTALVAAAVVPGPARRLMSLPPLRGLGLISYGVYLYHWPIFLWLSPTRTHLSQWPLFALRVGLTLVAAVVSYYVVEQPIRAGRLPGVRALLAAPVAAAVAVVALLAATVVPTGVTKLAAEASTGRAVVHAAEFTPPLAPATPTTPLRVLMVGDSVAYDAEPGVVAALTDTGSVSVVAHDELGLGLTQPHFDWRAEWAGFVDDVRPGLVILLVGGWDEGFIAQHGIAAYTDIAAEAARILTAKGAKLLVLGWPLTINRLTDRLADRRSVEAFAALPARFAGTVWYQALDPVLSPKGVYAAHLPGPDGTNERVRKLDGTHFCPAGAALIGRLVLDVVRPVWSLPDIPASWRTGDWIKNERYDHGACPP
jgi:peptidoglycan/LPS O-acetylase OafA/YrhL